MYGLSRARLGGLRAERGVTAVVVAIVMVMLVGIAAIAVDVAALWWDRKQVQNGADAGALAVAQACAQGEDSICLDLERATEYATEYAKSNDLADRPATKATRVLIEGGFVTVETSTEREAWFSRIWDVDSSSQVPARSTAELRKTPRTLKTVPLAVNVCQFLWQAGKSGDPALVSGDPAKVPPGFELTIDLIKNGDIPKDEKKGAVSCPTGPTKSDALPGSFGYLLPIDKDECRASVTAGENLVGAKPGNLPCVKGLDLKVGDIVVLPLFDKAWGTGAGVTYHIMGFAALEVTDLNISGVGNTYIKGKFVKFGALEDWPSGTGGTDYGVSSVRLVYKG